MATVEHSSRDERSRPDTGRRHGQDNLAEVITIRPVRSHRNGLVGSLVTMARVFASPRAQAAPVGTTPHPPSSPALLPFRPPQRPHDAA